MIHINRGMRGLRDAAPSRGIGGCSCRGMGDTNSTTTLQLPYAPTATTATSGATYTEEEVNALVNSAMDLVGTGQLIPGISNTVLIFGGIGLVVALAVMKR